MKLMNLLFKDRSLGYKFFVLPGIPVIVVVMFISANIFTSQKELLIEKAKKRASLLIELSILTVSNEFVIYNKNLLDNIVDNLSSEASVVYATIVDSSDNRILAHSDHDWDGKIVDNWLTSFFKEPGFFEFSGDIVISGKKYGFLKIGFSLKDVHQEIGQMKQRFLFVAFIAILLGAVFSIILARIISTPIKALVEQTKIVGAGNLENKIVYKSKDILGQLANEFNKMVSDLKSRKLQVIDSEARLRRLVENMPVMMDALEENSNVIVWNRECERVTGYSAAEMMGNPHSLKMLYPDDDYRKQMIKELSDMGFDFRNKEYTLTCKDGTEKTISWSNISARYPIPGWYTWATGVDITKRKQAEADLRASEEKFRLITETSIDGIFQLNDQRNLIYANNSISTIFGYTIEEAIGKPYTDFVDEKHQVFSTELFDNLVESQALRTEILLKHKSGHSFPAFLSAVPLFEKGKLVNITGILRDITELKAIEEQLRQARKMESIGTLAGGIAHDFNNILYMITGNVELALEDTPKWNPVHANLEVIKAAGLRAAGITRQLLSFSRKVDQALVPIEAIAVIKDALNFLRSTIPSTIEIRKNLPDTDVTILADPIQIDQVLMNLCTNASQAMEETGGILKVTVETTIMEKGDAKKHLDLAPGEYVKIAIIDTGPGIEPEISDRIFDPYFTTKEVGKGSGMGLAVVHGIIKNHGGAITVDSQLGSGTTFTILFPVVAEKPLVEDKTPDGMPLGNENILFVDDEEFIADMTQKMLERLGYAVETRLNPIEALELFQTKPHAFDLVITDMTMPQITGVKLSEKLKKIRSDIPVIICTGHSSLIDEKKAKEIGIAAYVMKPIVIRDLAKVIRKVLDDTKSSTRD